MNTYLTIFNKSLIYFITFLYFCFAKLNNLFSTRFLSTTILLNTMKKKILVIEDDQNLQKNLKDLLEEEDYLYAGASEGFEGLKCIDEWNPDLILCDISIPGIDGFEILRKVRQSEKNKSVIFIFVTAKVEQEDVNKSNQLGADGYIFKPFRIDELLDKINYYLKAN